MIKQDVQELNENKMDVTEVRGDRARIHESVREIYTALTEGSNIEQAPFASLKDVFMAAACIGYQKRKRKPLSSGKVASSIRSEVFSEKEKDILKGIALAETDDIHVLEKHPDEVVSGNVLTIAEEYAHGGIEELKISVIDKPGYAIWNLVDLIKTK